jgi:hypothetical protein
MREQEPKQPIPEAKARATSSAALEHGDLMTKRDRFQQQRGAGSRFAASGYRNDSFVDISIHRKLSPDARSRQ